MPKGGAWTRSNKSQMLSNALTVKNQGGGEKKAGFPYQIGRDSWASIFMNSCDAEQGIYKKCCNLTKLNQTLVFTKNTVRPIGNDSRIPMR